MQQAKPALVAELREAVSTCDEELQKLKARVLRFEGIAPRSGFAHALVRPQTSKEYLEGQAMEIEKNIKELLKTNEALARQIMAQ